MFPAILPDIIQIIHQHGVRAAILSPGSRNAPVNITIARHPAIIFEMVVDERSAAYYAMGKSIVSNQPVLLSCTSGTAALNYMPAIAEAFFMEVPLIVMTSDRPPEWIGQEDGQAVFQNGIYGQHVKGSYQIPEDLTHPDAQYYAKRMVNEAMLLANEHPKGPVHLNFPFREPFYPNKHEISFTKQKIKQTHSDSSYFDAAKWNEVIKGLNKILIIAGQQTKNDELVEYLKPLAQKIPVVAEKTANLSGVSLIEKTDAFISESLAEELKPDLLITFGKSLIARKLKKYWRISGPSIHWHIQPGTVVADPYSSLTDVIRTSPGVFFKNIEIPENASYLAQWQKREQSCKPAIIKEFGEFLSIRALCDQLKERTNLVVANSLPVRYLPFIDLNSEVEIFANRGTSGIDGLISTGVGIASESSLPTWIITGELSFLYDSNALWKEKIPPNLRILIINNGGGGIFRMIQGASTVPEMNTLFVVSHNRNAKQIAKDYEISYFPCQNQEELTKSIASCISKSGIIEVFTNPEIDKKIFKKLYHQ